MKNKITKAEEILISELRLALDKYHRKVMSDNVKRALLAKKKLSTRQDLLCKEL